MRKYWQYFRLRFERTFFYRGSVILFRISNILFLITLVAVWLAAKADGPIGGYSQNGLITYYLLGSFINSIVFWHSTPAIRTEIIDGEINTKTLSKPVSYYWQKFFEEMAWHTVSPLFAIISIVLVVIFIHANILLPVNLLSVPLLIISVGLASVVFFNLSSCLGLLSFWFTETEGVTSFVWMGVFLLGGQSVPVSFFPANLRFLIDLLPFRYMYSFPLEIYFGRLPVPELLQGFLVQLIWLVGLGLLFKLLWQKGIKYYSAYGG